MRRLVSATLLLFVLGCFSLPPRPVSVQLYDAETQLVGFVDFLKVQNGVQVRLHTLGLPPGRHGINLHANPVCEGPSFASAGPVFAPPGAGDSLALGNFPDFTSRPTDWTDTTFTLNRLELGDGDRGLFHGGGTALVITAEPDEGREPGSGNRIACGVVKPRPEER